MQEMLPDYVFDRLEADDRMAFERALPHYPDLSEEIKQVRSVFSKVEQMDIDGELRKRTMYMSEKVNSRLEKRLPQRRKPGITFKYLVPAFALGFIALTIFFPTTVNNFIKKMFSRNKVEITAEIQDIKIVNPNALSVLLDSAVTLDDVGEVVDNSMFSTTGRNKSLSLPDDELAEHLNYLLAEKLANDKGNGALGLEDIYLPSYQLLDGIDYLDEDELHFILDELDKSRINS